MMQKEILVHSLDGKLEKSAIKYGATGIIGKSQILKSYPESMFHKVEITSKEDVGALSELKGKVDYILLEMPDWKAIVTENVIAELQDSKTKIAVNVNNMNEFNMFYKALEVGVDTFIVKDPSLLKEIHKHYGSNMELNLVNATITELKNVDLGKRACVDFMNTFGKREGIVSGFFTGAYALKDAETMENQYINTREWRVNTGAASEYTLIKMDDTFSPKVLDDLVSGDEVLTVDHNGVTRYEVIGRVKKEKRPMTHIKFEYNGRIGSTSSQTAETVRLVTPEGSKSIDQLEIGDKIKVFMTEPVATHVGKPIKEKIIEV